MALRLKNINAALAKHGSEALLTRGDGCFYFLGGEAVELSTKGKAFKKVSRLGSRPGPAE